MSEDTICAPATPPVHSSISIIRISGPKSLGAARALFNHKSEIIPRHAYYGRLIYEGTPIDDVLLIYFAGPHSYTGEDMVEIHCHGNPLIVKNILKALKSMGLRYADPGEFTRRSFLNNKLDLTAAEAINHIIMARSEWEIQASLRQMGGALRDEISGLRDILILLKADIEAGIDFSEEDIEFVSRERAALMVADIQRTLLRIKDQCHTGERLSQGINVTITGKPNAGKSSLLNLLLNQERAIVSDIPGTTRDIIRESIQIDGILINLIDTAGINHTEDLIERMGIQRTEKSIESSQIILMVIDAVTGITAEDHAIFDRIKNKKVIYIFNKADMIDSSLLDSVRQRAPEPSIAFSALTGDGLLSLKSHIHDLIHEEYVDIEHTFIADLRIIDLLSEATLICDNILVLINAKAPDEIIASDIQTLLDTLSEITGEVSPEDVLDSIFSRFCIGK